MEKLREQYEKEVIPALMKKFEYKSVMQVPKLDKIVINIGLGDVKENPKSEQAYVALVNLFLKKGETLNALTTARAWVNALPNSQNAKQSLEKLESKR